MPRPPLNGAHCADCGHPRERHNLAGALGRCCRIGCSCEGYLEQLMAQHVMASAHEDLVVLVHRRFRHHRGYLDDVDDGQPK